jgi:glycerophosphoryl diester phosphodiesterase
MRFFILFLLPFVYWSQEDQVLFFGHRGCRGLLPENSIQSFQKAIELGVDGIELDVVVNKERQLVISHEPYFKASFCVDSSVENNICFNNPSLNTKNLFGQMWINIWWINIWWQTQ